jgi:cytidine deaminase
MPISNDELPDRARQAREKAVALYSDFIVGAALLCQDGSIFTGCNIKWESLIPKP